MSNRKATVLACIVLAALIAVILLIVSCSCSCSSKKAQDTVPGAVQQGPGSTGDGISVYAGTAAHPVTLMPSAGSLYVGGDGTLSLTVVRNEPISGTLRVTDDTGREIAVFEENADTAECTLPTGTEGIVCLTVRQGDEAVSAQEYIFIQPVLTDADVRAFAEVAAGLADLVKDIPYEEAWSEAALTAVENWLKAQDEVESVSRETAASSFPCLVYRTKAGIQGSYGFTRITEGYAGYTDLNDASSAWEASKRGSDLRGYFVRSSVPGTNDTYVILHPLSNDSTMINHSNSENDIISRVYSPHFSLGLQSGVNARELLKSGRYTDCGFVGINAHGSTLQRRNGRPRTYFCIASSEPEDDVYRFVNAEGLYNLNELWCWKKEGSGESRAMLDVSADRNGHVTASAYVTTLYMKEKLGNKRFDNSVVYCFICYGLADDEMWQLFLDRGASLVFGNTTSFVSGYSSMILSEIAESLITPKTGGVFGNYAEGFGNYDADSPQQFVDFVCGPAETEEDRANAEHAVTTYRNAANEVGHDDNGYAVMKPENGICTKRAVKGSADVRGRVTDSGGKPLAECRTDAYRWMDHTFECLSSAYTDSEGFYQHSSLQVGVYIIEAHYEDRTAYIPAAVIPEGKLITAEDIIFTDAGVSGPGAAVSADGYLYYWKYDRASYPSSVTGDPAFFPDEAVNNQFIRRDQNGNETVLFRERGNGDFVIIGDIVYFEYRTDNRYTGICSCRMDGTEKKFYGVRDSIAGVTPGGQWVILKSCTAINHNDPVNHPLANGTVVAMDGDVIYYTESGGSSDPESRMGKLTLCSIRADGTEQKTVFTTAADLYDEDDAQFFGPAKVRQAVILNDQIYFSYGSDNGWTYQGGKVIRAAVNGSGGTVVRDRMYDTDFVVLSDGSILDPEYSYLGYDRNIRSGAEGQFMIRKGSVWICPHLEDGKPFELISKAELDRLFPGYGTLDDSNNTNILQTVSIDMTSDRGIYGSCICLHLQGITGNDSTAAAMRQYTLNFDALIIKDLNTGKISIVYKQ